MAENQHYGIESSYFDWVGWDQIDTLTIQFEGCTLKKKIGEHEVGEQIPFITLSLDDSVLQIYGDDGELEGEYNIRLEVDHGKVVPKG